MSAFGFQKHIHNQNCSKDKNLDPPIKFFFGMGQKKIAGGGPIFFMFFFCGQKKIGGGPMRGLKQKLHPMAHNHTTTQPQNHRWTW